MRQCVVYLFPVRGFCLSCANEIDKHFLLHKPLGNIFAPLGKVGTSALVFWVLLFDIGLIVWNKRFESSPLLFRKFSRLFGIRGRTARHVNSDISEVQNRT